MSHSYSNNGIDKNKNKLDFEDDLLTKIISSFPKGTSFLWKNSLLSTPVYFFFL
jgi:hypothetical protein